VGVSIVVATFGSSVWQAMALQYAIPSAMAQGVEVIVTHERTLADARNTGARQATGEWLVHLDADDELADGYCAELLAADGDLRVAPLVSVDADGGRELVELRDRNMERLNPCHVGTMIRREMLLDCGGWPQFRAWEDWALFLRAYRRGASVCHLPDDAPAYVAHSRDGSRNSVVARPSDLHAQIRSWA
jgi:glycosyltransferase involved in cell wall biosynthesis